MSNLNAASLAALNARHALLSEAFKVVDPTRPAMAGHPAQDWRSPISQRGTRGAFDAAARHFGVTFGDIVESVEYFTATAATVTETAGVLHITADGYRAGPAGDH